MPATLGAQDRQGGANHPQRAEKIRLKIARDLGFVVFLDSADQAVASVVHHHVQPAKNFRRLRNHGRDLGRVRDVERERPTPARIGGDQFVERFRLTRGRDEAMAPGQHARRQRTTKPARTAGNEPDR